MCKQNVGKGGRLEPKVCVFRICVKLWRRGEETYLSQTYNRRGCGGRGLLLLKAIGDCLKFFGKRSYFSAIWITFCTLSEQFERTKFL